MKKSAAILLLAVVLTVISGCVGPHGTTGNSSAPKSTASSQDEPAETLTTENGTAYSCNTVLQFNGVAYFSDDKNLYSFDGKTTKVALKNLTDDVPLYFDLFNNKFIYINNRMPKIYVRNIYNLDDAGGEKSFGNLLMSPEGGASDGHFLVAEGHVFYKGKDLKLHRIMLDGSNDKIIYMADTEAMTYSYGYLFFLDQKNNLFRIKSDGKLLLKLTTSPVDSYYISAKGVVFLFRKGECTTLNLKTIKEQKVGKFPGTADDSLSVVGADESFIYFLKSYPDQRRELIREPLNQGESALLYQYTMLSGRSGSSFRPTLLDGWIYFYADQYCRIKATGTDLEKMGP